MNAFPIVWLYCNNVQGRKLIWKWIPSIQWIYLYVIHQSNRIFSKRKLFGCVKCRHVQLISIYFCMEIATINRWYSRAVSGVSLEWIRAVKYSCNVRVVTRYDASFHRQQIYFIDSCYFDRAIDDNIWRAFSFTTVWFMVTCQQLMNTWNGAGSIKNHAESIGSSKLPFMIMHLHNLFGRTWQKMWSSKLNSSVELKNCLLNIFVVFVTLHLCSCIELQHEYFLDAIDWKWMRNVKWMGKLIAFSGVFVLILHIHFNEIVLYKKILNIFQFKHQKNFIYEFFTFTNRFFYIHCLKRAKS